MKKTIISLLLTIAVVCSISINAFATNSTRPHVIVNDKEIVSLQ